MALLLSAADQRLLADAADLLLAPLEHADADAWRSAVNRRLRPLLGADMVSFLLPVAGGAALYSEELDPSAAVAYPNREPAIPGGRSIWERQLELGVWNRELVYGALLGDYYRSEYYTDYIVPNRAYDSLGLTIPYEGGSRRSVAGLLLHHTRADGARFGERGLQLLRLLKPAFAAGVATYRRHAGMRESFARTIDQTGAPTALLDVRGVTVHRTPALQRLLAHDRELRRVVESVAGKGGGRGRGTADPSITSEARTRLGRYRIYATRVSEELAGPGPLRMLSVEPVAETFPRPGELITRYGLTAAEARVAVLLAERLTNREIAETLLVSGHTARHHTERVLMKLGLSSRTQIRDHLTRDRVGDSVRRGMPGDEPGGDR